MQTKTCIWLFVGVLLSLPQTSLARASDTSGAQGDYLFELGRKFAIASQSSEIEERAQAKDIFKQVIKAIDKTQTPVEKYENWIHERQKFASMLVEAFTVAVAITAAEIFLHPKGSAIETAGVVSAVLSPIGVVVGAYMPYHWLAESMKKKQSRKMLNSFFMGISAEMPLPTGENGLRNWLLSVVGPIKAYNRCQDWLS